MSSTSSSELLESTPEPASSELLALLTSQPLDEATSERALTQILEIVHLRHGALLRYDSDSQSLSMVAQVGLSPQAVGAIRSIRRGVSGAWDMPLHAVQQRRVYIIDKPKENPFVPPLLPGADQGVLTNAAVLPLFAVGSVTGALLLVASGKRAVHETDILALREVSKALGSALRAPSRVANRAAGAPLSTAVRDDMIRDRAVLTARISELEALVDSLRRTAASGSADAERRLGELARERERYKSEAALHEITLRNLRSEHDLLRGQSAAEAERVGVLSIELTRAREELAIAVETGQRASERLERGDRSRMELEQRLAVLEAQLGEKSRYVETGETTRTELSTRLQANQRDLDALRESLRSREEVISDLRAERERLTTSLHKAASRYQTAEDAASQLRESSETTIAELQGQAEGLRVRAEAAERARDQLQAGLTGRTEVVQEIERETERYQAELARETERRRVAEQTASSVIHDAAALRAESERIQAEHQLAHAEAERARGEAEGLASELEALRASSSVEIEGLREAEADRARRSEELDAARAALASEAERLRHELEAHRAREVERQARDAERTEAEQRHSSEFSELRRRLESATESSRATVRERDALLARVATLEETTAKLLQEGESLRAERDQRDEQLQAERDAARTTQAELEGLRNESDGLRDAIHRLEDELAKARAAQTESLEHGRMIEQELSELRSEFERAQTRGSELTAELARRAKLEEELQSALAGARREIGEATRRREEDDGGRKELEARLREMEQALQGASADLAAQGREIDFSTVLRATLAKSENVRRAAEDSSARLEEALAVERRLVGQLRSDLDGERETTNQLAQRLDDVERRLADSEEAAAEANHRAAMLVAERDSAHETAQSLAADLGRRSAETNDLSTRLESLQQNLGGRERAIEEALERIGRLETEARTAAQEADLVRRQAAAARDERDQRIRELEVRLAENATHGEQLAAELAAAEATRNGLQASMRALEGERRQASEGTRGAEAKAAALEAAAGRAQAENERLAAELDALRQQAGGFEAKLRTLETESGRWRSLAESLQSTLETRDREMQALRAAPRAPAAPAPATPPKPAAPAPAAARRAATARAHAPAVSTSRTVVILDDPGSSANSLAALCSNSGFEPKTADTGTPLAEIPAFTAVNLLATTTGGFAALQRSRVDEMLGRSRLLLYANKPGSTKGVVFANVECLIRPVEEKDFVAAISALIGNGKRVTIIGEELDSVLALNAWATAKGCTVSSAGDVKQGGEILDIVKPELLVFDLSRLGGDAAALVVKAPRSSRLDAVPMLLVLPPAAQAASASFFLKRLTTLAEETPLDFAPALLRLAQPAKA